jgi:hypothetical protein
LSEFVVFGVDGSRLELPRTAANAAQFAPAAVALGGAPRYARRSSTQSPASRRKKGAGPQLWLTTVCHAGTGCAWDWRLGPADSSERHPLREMLDDLPEQALITADAGFVGYETWQAVLDAGHEFVIRVGGNVRLLRKLGFARESQGTVYLWPDREARRAQPPLVLRAYRHAIRHSLAKTSCSPALTARLSRSLVDAYVRESKPSRDYPRRRTESPPSPPTIAAAINSSNPSRRK